MLSTPINPADPATIPKFVDELPKPVVAKPKDLIIMNW